MRRGSGYKGPYRVEWYRRIGDGGNYHVTGHEPAKGRAAHRALQHQRRRCVNQNGSWAGYILMRRFIQRVTVWP